MYINNLPFCPRHKSLHFTTQVNLKKSKSIMFLEINLWFSNIDELLAQMSSIFFHLTLNLDLIMYKVFFFS